MKTYRINALTVLLSLLVLSVSAVAAPSAGIRSLLTTPASAFDVFLHQIYMAANGATYFGGSNMKEKVRIFQLDYDVGTNLITMRFHISPDHETLAGFKGSTVERKKELMLGAARTIAVSLGLDERLPGMRFGLIQAQKIRNGWANKDFNEDEVKEEIVGRTVMELINSYEDKTIYMVRRNPAGTYSFSMDTK